MPIVCSIWLIDRALSVTTTPGKSGPGSNGAEGVLHFPQISKARASLSDGFVRYPGYFLGNGSYPSIECNWCILQLQPTGLAWWLTGWRLKAEYFLVPKSEKKIMKTKGNMMNWYVGPDWYVLNTITWRNSKEGTSELSNSSSTDLETDWLIWEASGFFPFLARLGYHTTDHWGTFLFFTNDGWKLVEKANLSKWN